RNGLDYCTVNIDYGCGIIVKNRTLDHSRLSVPTPDQKLMADWLAFHDDYTAAFEFFSKNHERLLRLVSAKAFARRFSKKVISPMRSHSPLLRKQKLAA